MTTNTRRLASFLACAAVAFAGAASAQQYPTKPIRIINPWTPAGPAELLARTIGTKLQESLGQTVLIESRPGANGTIGASFVAKSAPDGYTILFSHVGPMAIHPAVAPSMPYDTVKDFEPITQVAAGALVLLVRNDIPAKSVAELVTHAKANAGKLSCGSVGPASTTHFACEMLNMMGGISTIHVPYKGSAPVVTDMLGGQISISFLNIAGVMPQLKANQLRPIAVTTLKRSAVLPEVPTMHEIMPGFEVNSWYGMMAPAGTPKAIVQLLARETAKALKAPDVNERLRAAGLDPVGNTPEEHAAQIKGDLERWARVAKTAKIRID
ncbi:MAG: tripartite tricarboxylate transporter substrate binding protein [Betaproteobacteria bacterium]